MADAADDFALDRCQAVPALLGDYRDFLIIAGLAGTGRDIAALTKESDNGFILGGAMGAAVMMGLGLALAQPDKRVLVITGDGELLMNVGALATVAVINPPNLSIVCVDNGHYGETGNQVSHTSLGTDLEQMAKGAGIKATRTVHKEGEIADAARLIRESNTTSFVLMRVKDTEPPKYMRNFDGAERRLRFRMGMQEAEKAKAS